MGATAGAEAVEVRYETRDDGGFRLRVMENEAPVAKLAVGRYAMHVAGVPVTMGGIADVVAHPAYRGKGYGARQLRAAVDHMRRERYPLSILWGIPNFYHRFGYTPVIAEYAVTVSTRDAERLAESAAGSAGAVRPARADDVETLLALYTQTQSGRTGTLARTVGKYDLDPKPDGDNWWTHPRRVLVAEAGGRPAAYATLHGNPAQLRILEVIVPREHAATAGVALVGALAQEAITRRLESVRLPLPPDEPLADLLKQTGCKLEVTYPTNGGGMGRIVDLSALSDALTPALAARAAALPEASRPASLELVATDEQTGEEQRATVSLESTSSTGKAGTISLSLPQHRLCQLVMGYRSVDAILLQHPDACAAQALPAVRALFPEGYPHMWALDHF